MRMSRRIHPLGAYRVPNQLAVHVSHATRRSTAGFSPPILTLSITTRDIKTRARLSRRPTASEPSQAHAVPANADSMK
jgi:hypothetical protein